IEYALVSTHGKTHESLLRTDAEPLHLQLALLLLGATNSPSSSAGTSSGSAVSIEIAWKRGWWWKRRHLEELVRSRRDKRALSRAPWIYTGSRTIDGTFAAQSSGSIISLIGDPEALINRAGADPADDENWLPFARRIPRVNTQVQVSIHLHTR
ncbi:MAG TPA: YdjY domain-containing protein, partial [Methylomirabilota bacterium]|nr:YdjY domain-containing protein [Methylomirabilota bacterium]